MNAKFHVWCYIFISNNMLWKDLRRECKNVNLLWISILHIRKQWTFVLHRVCSHNDAEANGTRIIGTLSLLEYRSFEILNVRLRIYSELNKFHYFVNNNDNMNKFHYFVNNDDNILREKYAFLFIHSIYLLYTRWQIPLIYVLIQSFTFLHFYTLDEFSNYFIYSAIFKRFVEIINPQLLCI